MFIKLSLILVVMALACNAEQKRDYLINVVESEVFDGSLALQALLGQDPLKANETAIIIARTKGKKSVKVEQYSLADLQNINSFKHDCDPTKFEHTFWACTWAGVRAYPNLAKYCDECIKIHKEKCKKSLKDVFKDEMEIKSLEIAVRDLMEMEGQCKVAGYDMNDTWCLEDYLSKFKPKDYSRRELILECEKFAKKLELAINLYDLDRARPVGDLGQEYPWLETAARNCGKVEVALEKLRLAQKGMMKGTNLLQ
jgi:hypothetical protein